MALDLPGRFLAAEMSTWVSRSASFQQFLWRPQIPIRIIRASCARKDIPKEGTFPNLSNISSSNFLSQGRPAAGSPYKFLSRGTAGSSTVLQLLGLCRGGILIRISGHSSFGIPNNLGASVTLIRVYDEIASLISPAIPGSFFFETWPLRALCTE